MLIPSHILYPVAAALTFATIAALLLRRFLSWLAHPSHKPIKLLSITEVESHLRGNPYVTHGYRASIPSMPFVARSLFQLHNETFNIWSHLLGAVYFAGLTVLAVVRAALEEQDEVLHRVTVIFFTVGATLLCTASAVFHAVSCHSREVYELTAKLDYSGITLMILFSFFPIMHNMFFCLRSLAVFYSVSISVLVSLACELFCFFLFSFIKLHQCLCLGM